MNSPPVIKEFILGEIVKESVFCPVWMNWFCHLDELGAGCQFPYSYAIYVSFLVRNQGTPTWLCTLLSSKV